MEILLLTGGGLDIIYNIKRTKEREMKKRLLLSVLVISLILPICLMFTGCGTKKTYTVSIGIKDKDTNNWVMIKQADGTETTKVSTEHGETLTLDVLVRDYLDETTLKIYNGEDEITLTPDQTFVAPTQFDGSLKKIGTIELEKVKSDIKLSCTITERLFSFTFEKTDDSTISAEKQTILSDLVLDDDKSLYYALTTADYVYKTTYEKAVNEGMELTSQKPTGYYDLSLLGVTGAGAPSLGLNKYVIKSTSELTASNILTLNPNGVQVAKLIVKSEEEGIVGFQKNSEAITLNEIEITAGETARVKIILSSDLGAELDTIKVYVNGTEIVKTTDGYYFDISLEKMPVHYGIDGDVYTYEVTIA